MHTTKEVNRLIRKLVDEVVQFTNGLDRDDRPMTERLYNAITWRFTHACATIVCHIAGHNWHYFTMHGDNGTTPQFFRCCMRCEKTESIEARLFRDRG